MSGCFAFNLTEFRNSCYREAFLKCGLRPTLTELPDDATAVHFWAPHHPDAARPNLLLVHGLGANALWQWGDVLPHLVTAYNVYVPDLLFFGDSLTTRPDRSERFQAECIGEALERGFGVAEVAAAVGLSYGGFVVYAMAAGGRVAVGRVVVCGSGVAMEERDLKNGLLRVSDLEEAAGILVPLTPRKLKELVGYTFYRPPPIVGLMPSCLLNDFIDAMCRDYVEEKKELIRAIPKDRKLSALPKITQTLIIWGEHDQVFPLELGHRLKRYLGDNAHLAVIKNAGHAFNVEKPKEYLTLLKSVLLDLQLPPESLKLEFEYQDGTSKQENNCSNSMG